MRVWDLSSGTAKLELAMESLQKAWNKAGEEWDDQTRRNFHRTHLAPMEPKFRKALDAIGRLEHVLTAAKRECGSR